MCENPKSVFSLDCGGCIVSVSSMYSDTRRYFASYPTETENAAEACMISVDKQFMEDNRWLVSEDERSDAFLEFQCLMLAAGNHLLQKSRALFHGVAYIWRDLAWIITAPSGTGKTTQFRHWRRLWRKEIQIINGDKPLLECRKDGSIWVHSSPWMGKENLGSPDLRARLGGIILLEQGDQNRICRLSPAEAVLPFWREFVSLPENTDQILCQADILDRMLSAVPVWKLVNVGNEESAILTRDTLAEYLEERYE